MSRGWEEEEKCSDPWKTGGAEAGVQNSLPKGGIQGCAVLMYAGWERISISGRGFLVKTS